MLKNYFKIAWRNLVKHKAHTLINIVGLAGAVSFCLLSFLFVRHEHSFDRFHRDSDRIYLAYRQYRASLGLKPSGSTPPILAPTIKDSLPEIENVVRVEGWSTVEGAPVRRGDKVMLQKGYHVDPNFFELFSFPVVAGNPENVLEDRSAVVITSAMAELYFGRTDPLGQELYFRNRNEEIPFVIQAVVDCPKTSSLQFDFLLSYALIDAETNWGSNNLYTFIKTSSQATPTEIENKFLSFFRGYFKNQTREDGTYFGHPDQPLRLLPLHQLYLNNIIRKWLTVQSDPVYSYILAGIALAVLLIACVNFVNLSLGLSGSRCKEIGLRKVVGANRIQLMKQHLSESLLLSLLSLILGMGLAIPAVPFFGRLMDRSLSFDFSVVIIPLLLLALLVGFLSGFYPALVMSKFHPVSIIKGRLQIGGKSRLSSGLVVLQFALSTILIVATLTMARQMQFMRQKNLGFQAEQVVVIDGGGWRVGLGSNGMRRMLEVYRQLAEQHPELINVSITSMSFGRGDLWGTGFKYQGKSILCRMYTIGYDYADTLGMRIVQGREFSRDFPGDKEESVMVNESLIKIFGWDNPLGKTIPSDNDMLPGRIIGVFEDSHLRSLHYEVEPAVFHLKRINGSLRYIVIRIAPENLSESIQLLEATWKQAAPNRPFVFSFLDEDVDRIFKDDKRWADIARSSASFAILIACLGAFGLTSLAVARRTKEVGIRKILGATEKRIAILLSKDFSVLVLISNFIAWPAAYFLLTRWLQNFAYRIHIGWEVFLLGTLLAFLITLATVSLQVIKAARANPVKSLRYE